MTWTAVLRHLPTSGKPGVVRNSYGNVPSYARFALNAAKVFANVDVFLRYISSCSVY